MLQSRQMVPRKSSQKTSASQPPQYRTHPPRPPSAPPEIVDPVWLVKALAILIVAALLCGYATCASFSTRVSGSLILHPSQRPAAIPQRLLKLPWSSFGSDRTSPLSLSAPDG